MDPQPAPTRRNAPTMLGYDSEALYAGLGPGWGFVVPAGTSEQKNRKREYVSAGPGWLNPADLHSLPETLDDLCAQFGTRVYRAMLTDATVRSAYTSIKLGILDGGVSLASPVKFPAKPAPKPKAKGEPGKPGGKPGDKTSPAGDTGDGLDPDQKQAKTVLEFCQRTLGRLGESLGPQLFAALDAMAFGVKLAEVTCAVPKEGLDAGKLVIDSVKVRPGWSWRFLIDAYLNVQRILTWDASTGDYITVDPDKFAWLTWMPDGCDPRGTSILRAAYTAWNLKLQTWPMLYAHLVRFGSPGIDIEMAEGDTDDRQPLDADGNELPTADPVSATQYMIQAARLYKSGGIMAHPSGSKVDVFEPNSDGAAMRAAIDLWDRQICLAIEMQARVTLEAKSGSKADSETSQDTKSLVNAYGRELVAGFVRRILRNNVRDNFGADAAERFTPLVIVGEGEKQDQPVLISALSGAGWKVAPSQMQEIDAMLGMPVRDPEEDAKAAEAALALQQKMAGPGDGTPRPPGSGAKEQAKPKPGAKT